MGLIRKAQGAFTSADITSTAEGEVSGDVRDGDEFFSCDEAHLHPHAHKLGGIACIDSKLREEQQQAIKEWLATMGKRFLTGNRLASTPAPVKIFEPRSNLQKLTDPWVYTHLLLLAAQQTDKVHRMKYVVAWLVAGIRHTFDTWKKPFNPILGETWQARNSEGFNVFMEQISHHPPVAAFTLNSPLVQYIGTAELGISIVVNHRGFKQTVKGSRMLRFADGGEIEIAEMPTCITKGVTSSADLRGDVTGRAYLRDTRHAFGATIIFGPVPRCTEALYARTDAVTCVIAPLGPTPGPTPGGSISGMTPGATPSASMCGGSPRESVRSLLASERNDTGDLASATDRGERKKLLGRLTAPLREMSQNSHASSSMAGGPAFAAPLPANTNNNGSSLPGSSFKLPHVPSVSSWLKGSFGGAEVGSFDGAEVVVHTVLQSNCAFMHLAQGSFGGAEVVTPPDHHALAIMRGNWLSHLDFEVPGGESERVWTMGDVEASDFECVPLPERLLSDSSFREDALALKAGDVAAAQAAKDRIEQKQRRERKLRPKQ